MNRHDLPDVDLRIDSLALDGVAPADRARLLSALRRELARLHLERGAAQRPSDRRRLVVASRRTYAAGGSDPAGLGREAARSIWRAMSEQGIDTGAASGGGQPPTATGPSTNNERG